MNISLISPEEVEILSRITGRKLDRTEITPQVLFLVNLIIILMGVIYADGVITEEEKQRLKITIDQFISSEENIGDLAELIIGGVTKNRVFNNFEDIQKITAPLSPAEKMLLVSMGYEISVIEGNNNRKNQEYLQKVARKIKIDSKPLKVVEVIVNNTNSLEDLLFFISLPAKVVASNYQYANVWFSQEIQAPASQLQELIKPCLNELSTAENIWNNKRKLEALSRHNIIEQVGELSGLRVKNDRLAKSFQKTVNNQVNESWELWLTHLQKQLQKQWSCQIKIETQNTQARERLIKSYYRNFTQELKEELENFLNKIMNRHLAPVDRALNIISSNISLLPENTDTQLCSTIIAKVNEISSHTGIQDYWKEKSLETNNSEFDIMNFASELWGNVTGSSVFTSVAEMTKIFPFSHKKEDRKQQQFSIKEVVFEIGWENFVSSKNQLITQIEELTILIVDLKIKQTKSLIDETISLYCKILDTQALYQQETLEQQQAEKIWIATKRQQLEQMQNELEAILDEATFS